MPDHTEALSEAKARRLKIDLLQTEDALNALHERAARLRDQALPGTLFKAEARSIANRIERALQQLERIRT